MNALARQAEERYWEIVRQILEFYRRLRSIDSGNSLLSYVSLYTDGFESTPSYHQRYSNDLPPGYEKGFSKLERYLADLKMACSDVTVKA